MDVRIARLHNVFGPYGTWFGGREKAPAALCRKVAEAQDEHPVISVWGSGDQTRSFLYIDECIEGLRRIMRHPCGTPPLNVGSEEMIAINDLVYLIAEIANKSVRIENVPGPEGVRGRNSDNRLIKQVLDWAPSGTLRQGLERLYPWVLSQVQQKERDI